MFDQTNKKPAVEDSTGMFAHFQLFLFSKQLFSSTDILKLHSSFHQPPHSQKLSEFTCMDFLMFPESLIQQFLRLVLS
jgi:hypothetical protein